MESEFFKSAWKRHEERKDMKEETTREWKKMVCRFVVEMTEYAESVGSIAHGGSKMLTYNFDLTDRNEAVLKAFSREFGGGDSYSFSVSFGSDTIVRFLNYGKRCSLEIRGSFDPDKILCQ
jgi:hypothetical protein